MNEQPEQYRVEGTSLFEYKPEQDAYVHVYRNDRCTSERELIDAYERHLESDID